MAQCPKLEYHGYGYFGNSNDRYVCTVTGQEFYVDDPKIKYTCSPQYGYEYEKCPIYQNS